jgi:hypothetical protein
MILIKFVVLCFIVFLCASSSCELVVFDPGKWLYRTRSEGLTGYSCLSVLLPLRVRLGHLSWNNSGGSATQMNIGTLRNTIIIKGKVWINRLLFLVVVVVVLLGRRELVVVVVVDDLLDAPCFLLLPVFSFVTPARVSRLVILWIIDEGLLLLIEKFVILPLSILAACYYAIPCLWLVGPSVSMICGSDGILAKPTNDNGKIANGSICQETANPIHLYRGGEAGQHYEAFTKFH